MGSINMIYNPVFKIRSAISQEQCRNLHRILHKENTRLFFDLIDRRYSKEGNYSIIFTSNKNPSEWRNPFLVLTIVLPRSPLSLIAFKKQF